MGNNGHIPSPGKLERDLKEYTKSDATYKKYKKQYNQGVAIGLTAIFLSLGIFVYMIFYLMSHLTALNIALFAVSVALFVAVLIIVPMRLRRMQAMYFASAGDSAGEYVSGLVKNIKER